MFYYRCIDDATCCIFSFRFVFLQSISQFSRQTDRKVSFKANHTYHLFPIYFAHVVYLNKIKIPLSYVPRSKCLLLRSSKSIVSEFCAKRVRFLVAS